MAALASVPRGRPTDDGGDGGIGDDDTMIYDKRQDRPDHRTQ
jgi:hypothetical protein